MAKQRDNANGSDRKVYWLPDKQHRDKVVSNVRSLNLVNADGGKVAVPKEALAIDGEVDGKGTPVKGYRYSDVRTVPTIVLSEVTDRAALHSVVDALCDSIRDYDSADEIGLRTADGREVTAVRKPLTGKDTPFTIAESADGKQRLTAEQYVAQCILNDHVLNIQKRMYKANADKAEQELRVELGINAPVGKTRTKRETATGDEADDLRA